MLTQHIMQQVGFSLSFQLMPQKLHFTQALIKRKLEEQKENFRRRQGDEGPLHSQPPSTQSEALGQPPLAKVTSISSCAIMIRLSRRCPNRQWPILLPSPSRPPR